MHLPYMRPCQNNNNCVTSKKITENGIFQQRKKKKSGAVSNLLVKPGKTEHSWSDRVRMSKKHQVL